MGARVCLGTTAGGGVIGSSCGGGDLSSRVVDGSDDVRSWVTLWW